MKSQSIRVNWPVHTCTVVKFNDSFAKLSEFVNSHDKQCHAQIRVFNALFGSIHTSEVEFEVRGRTK